MIYVLSVMHTGSRFVWETLGVRLEDDFWHFTDLPKDGCRVIGSHTRHKDAIVIAKDHTTIVPLRHPALVATSWKKRIEMGRRAHLGPDRWLDEWRKLDGAIDDAFFFPVDLVPLPYDELESLVGWPLKRDVQSGARRNSIGDYPEKASISTAKKYLGKEWTLVEQALETKVGERFYGDL